MQGKKISVIQIYLRNLFQAHKVWMKKSFSTKFQIFERRLKSFFCNWYQSSKGSNSRFFYHTSSFKIAQKIMSRHFWAEKVFEILFPSWPLKTLLHQRNIHPFVKRAFHLLKYDMENCLLSSIRIIFIR